MISSFHLGRSLGNLGRSVSRFVGVLEDWISGFWRLGGFLLRLLSFLLATLLFPIATSPIGGVALELIKFDQFGLESLQSVDMESQDSYQDHWAN